jgi:phosphoglycolate phosphatase
VILSREKTRSATLVEVSKQFGIAPSHILAIGDSSNDDRKRAQACPVLTVPYGYNHGEAVQTIQSDGIVGTLLEAARLLATENQH